MPRIDWKILGQGAWSIALLFVGGWVAPIRAAAEANFVFWTRIDLPDSPPNSVPITINAHSVILSNAGQKAATNVRLRHVVLPDFVIFPAVAILHRRASVRREGDCDPHAGAERTNHRLTRALLSKFQSSFSGSTQSGLTLWRCC